MLQVFLSTRKGAWILNRVGDYGYPIDVVIFTRLKNLFTKMCHPSLVNMYMESRLNQRFNHEMYGLKPKHRYVPMGEQGGNSQGTN